MVDMAVRSGTTTKLRVDRPDGTSTEIVWHDLGRSTIAYLAEDGSSVRRYGVIIEPDGEVTVTRAVGDEPDQTIGPTSTATLRNPYGATVEEYDYGGVVHVEYGFDDEGRFRTALVKDPWGRQDLELHPDLGRTLSWSCPLHHGKGSWNAWGTLDHYEVSFGDGSSMQWDLVGDRGRETIVGWDGRTVVVEDAAPPTVSEGPR